MKYMQCRLVLLGFCLTLLFACTAKPVLTPPSVILDAGDYVVTPVYFGTDRAIESDRHFGYKYSDTVAFGMCMVSIPKNRKPGLTASLLNPQDPAKNTILQKTIVMESVKFFATMKQEVKIRKEILVYIHGFNSTFEDAARSMGQIRHDMGFEGMAVFYSWPSKGDISPPGYVHDKDIIGASTKHLRDFLKDLASISGAESIHIIAHSIGNAGLMQALAEMAHESKPNGKPILGQVMIVAPDMNVETFKQLAHDIRKIAKRITLYASSKDKALMVSKEINGGLQRAGEANDEIIVIADIDTIDVSNVDTSLSGHSYYGESGSVIADMKQLLKGQPPEKRSLLPNSLKSFKYWVLQTLPQ